MFKGAAVNALEHIFAFYRRSLVGLSVKALTFSLSDCIVAYLPILWCLFSLVHRTRKLLHTVIYLFAAGKSKLLLL